MTAAAAALGPGLAHGPGPGADADDTQVISWADFRAWERQLASSGGCSHPIRMRGRIDAIDERTWNVPAMADGKLYIRNNREMACYDLTSQ